MPDSAIQYRLHCQLEVLRSRQLTALRFSAEAILCIESCSTEVVRDHYGYKCKVLQCIYAAVNYLVVHSACQRAHFQPRWLVMNYSTTMKFNGVDEKDPKDFSALWISHRTCLLKL